MCDHVVVDWSCWNLRHRSLDRIRSSARTRAVLSDSVLVIGTCENTPRLEPGVCGCGPICGGPSASQSQRSESASEGAAFLFNFDEGFTIGVCTCVTLCCAQRGVSLGDYRSCRAAQIVTRRFQAHSSTFENLSMELGGRAIPEPWPIPPRSYSARSGGKFARFRCAGPLRNRGTGDELTSSQQLHCAAQTDFHSVVRLLDATPPTHICSACKNGC